MVESQHIEDDGVMYGDDSAADEHVYLHDADMLDQPELYYGAQGVPYYLHCYLLQAVAACWAHTRPVLIIVTLLIAEALAAVSQPTAQ